MKKPTNARAEYLALHPHEKAVQDVIIKTLCDRIGTFRKETEKFAMHAVNLCNDASEIGFRIIELWQDLPGGTMTLDFWQQMQGLFIDQYGQQISLEQLKIFVRIHNATPSPVTDPQVAISWRQEIMKAAGFQLESGSVGTTAHEVDYYNKLFANLDPRKVSLPLQGLRDNARFGPVAAWPEEIKQSAILQVAPMKKEIDAFWDELHIKTIE
jgi:hypothetical protein